MVFESNEKNKPDFVYVRTRTPSEVLSLLLFRFPGVRELAGSDDELHLAEPFHAYELLAQNVRRRADDQAFLAAVGKFIDELVEDRGDELVQAVLTTSLLEGIAEDPEATAALMGFLGANARTLLRDVEAKIYGR
jgi:hypothetical protein